MFYCRYSYSDQYQSYYYINKNTKCRQWEHPLDAEYKQLVERVRKQFAVGGGNDVSEDASQIDSGIRSLQGDDSADLLTDISPTPTMKMMEGSVFPSPGGVRFLTPLEKRHTPSTALTHLQPLESARNRRFEVTNHGTTATVANVPHIGLSIRSDPKSGAIPKQSAPRGDIKGLTLTGTGSMFLKSNTRKTDALDSPPMPSGKLTDVDMGASRGRLDIGSRGFKSILRDSSLTDVRNRSADMKQSDSDFEEKKIVRFLEQPFVAPAGDVALSDESSNDEEDVAEWDFDVEGEETHVKDIRVTNRMMPPLILGDSALETVKRPLNRLTSLNRTASNESVASGGSDKPSLVTLFDNGRIRPLYEDTDSESAISVRGTGIVTAVAKPIVGAVTAKKDTESLDVLEVEQMAQVRMEMQQRLAKFEATLAKEQETEEQNLRHKMHSELEKLKSDLVGKQKAELQSLALNLKLNESDESEAFALQRKQLQQEHVSNVIVMEKQLADEINDRKIELESQHNVAVENFKRQLQDEFEEKRIAMNQNHRSAEETLQHNHKEILDELQRDLKLEEDLLRKEHATRLTQVKEHLAHELDIEKNRMRETGESRLYEKIRCEKRLLEDKYKCLKEKYGRLKADVKLSLERRNQRKEQQQSITTGSETERSNSNKQSFGNSELRSSSISAPLKAVDMGKPPALPPPPRKNRPQSRDRISAERESRKMAAAAKYLAHVQQYQDDTTSISQSDTTVSNQFMTSGKLLAVQANTGDNGNSDSEAFVRNAEANNNNREGVGRPRKKQFSRTKSASTSRLNATSRDVAMRPCSPVENLRRQLRKLEDLEDQFPDNSLDTTYHLRYPFKVNAEHGKDNNGGHSSELEFFKHRIHLERDSVRRAKESLRTQRTNFRSRQRDIKQRQKVVNRHTIDHMFQEEKELTEMEVNLHRTRALLGEKVIRLRHLEQSLQRVYDKDKPSLDAKNADGKLNNKDDVTLSDLSSHSSSGFSSTDFASDTLHENLRRKEMYQESGEIIQSLENLNAEIREIWDILSKQQVHGLFLSIIVETHTPKFIRFIYLYFSGLPPPPAVVYQDIAWPVVTTNPMGNLTNVLSPQLAHQQQSAAILQAPIQTMPSLADRLETYRQLTGSITSTVANSAQAGAATSAALPPDTFMAGLMSSSAAGNSITAQSAFGNYTSSLVERTQDLRNWLRQAKTEHELLSNTTANHSQTHM